MSKSTLFELRTFWYVLFKWRMSEELVQLIHQDIELACRLANNTEKVMHRATCQSYIWSHLPLVPVLLITVGHH